LFSLPHHDPQTASRRPHERKGDGYVDSAKTYVNDGESLAVHSAKTYVDDSESLSP
jgi:hypothetical protein